MFRRWDVDEFLTEIDHDSFNEWDAFNQLEPTNWQATRLMTQRLSFVTAQANSTKKLNYRDYDIVMGGNQHSPEIEKLRWRAFGIQQNIANGKPALEDVSGE